MAGNSLELFLNAKVYTQSNKSNKFKNHLHLNIMLWNLKTTPTKKTTKDFYHKYPILKKKRWYNHRE